MSASKPVTICSVGDLMICDSPLYASIGVGSNYNHIRQSLFAHCKSAFNAADIVIGNFETVVHQPRNRSLTEKQMCCSEQVIIDLKEAGFSVLNLANNHCMQHGTEGFEQTRMACKTNGIQPIGIRGEEPFFCDIRGVKIAMLSLCIHLEWYDPEHIRYEDRIERIIRSVAQLREQDEKLVIIVSVHWGDEFADYPSNAQIALAHRLVDCGADVLLGHHPHVVQGTEQYKNSLIVYSLGNFVSDMVPEMCRQTGIVSVRIEPSEDGKKISYDWRPLRIGDDFVPVPAEGDWLSHRQETLVQALHGAYTDDDYWQAVSRNHRLAHNSFKDYFQRNLGKYNPAISSKMLAEFVGRKVKRILGTSTDGRVSSMDSAIYQALKDTE